MKCEHRVMREEVFTYLGKRVWVDLYCLCCGRFMGIEQRLYRHKWWKMDGTTIVEKLHNSGKYRTEPLVSFLDLVK